MNKIKRNVIQFVVLMIIAICFTGCTNKDENNEIIGIIGATNNEVITLKEALTDMEVTKIAEMEFCKGKLGENNVVVVQCGMGKVNAGICAQTLISTYGCTKIINTGVAGSLDNRLDIGDLVISIDAVQHDFTVEAIGFEKGEIPYTGRYAFPADEQMRKDAIEAQKAVAPNIKSLEGRVCSGDQFISEKEQKEKIINDFGGMCCEMEGGAIAHVCYLNSIPFVIIRAVSDKADGSSSMEYTIFEEEASKNCARIVQYMVENMD